VAQSLTRWREYAKERFPLLTYALLSGGIAASSAMLGGDGAFVGQAASTFVGVMLFFFTLRLMDELKDYEKDVVAHPERPLPRGVLERSDVAAAIRLLVFAMVVYGALLRSPAYLVVTAWLWLMYKEFYVGAWLARSPFLYAVTHQVILLPLAAFGAATRTPALEGYAVTVLGAFFTYEICRKLDPKAHPVLKTYIEVYKHQKTLLLVLITTAVAALGAYRLGLWGLWPVEALVPLSFLRLFKKPEGHKPVELLATLSLLVHLYAGVLAALL
jgi:4-hydroxybenzoate polyprenyltransferase